MALKIIGQDWADRYPEKFTPIEQPTPHPCFICGDPTGNCAPHVEDEPMTAKKRPSDAPSPAAGGRRHVVVEEPPEGFTAGEGNTDMIVSVRDVYISFIPRNAKRASQVLLYPKGAVTSFASYHKRLQDYAGYSSLEVK